MKKAWLVGLLLVALAARAQDDAETGAAFSNKVMKFLASLDYRTGSIGLGDNLATLKVPETFRYLGSADAEKILRLWGNPPSGEPPLGLLLPAGMTPLDSNTWAVIIQWSPDGYVKDDDAHKIDYADLLKTMQKACKEESAERVKEGYDAIELLGWATPPRYDAASHKMYWAKELKFGDEPEHVLNYNIRVLGRHGVLVLNAVASVSQLQEIEQATPQILGMVDFNDGKRYADFDPSKDHYAAYGLAALVAGGVAAKAGLFKGLIALLIASKKFVIIGVVALVAVIKKMFGRRGSPS